jgi:hypothetical protein
MHTSQVYRAACMEVLWCGVASLTPCPNLPRSFLYHVCGYVRVVWVGVGVCACVDLSEGAGLVRRIQKLKSPACGEAGCDCTRWTGNASDASCRVTGALEDEKEEGRLRWRQQRGMEVESQRVTANSGARVTTALAQQTARVGKGGDAREESLEEDKAGSEESEDEMRPYYINDWANFTASREKILDMAKECALSASLPQSDLENPFALYTQR